MQDNIHSTTESTGLTLVLGGTGKTGRRVADRLASRGVPTRVASRSSDPSFDWGDQSTWDAALDGVTAAYLTYAPDLAIPGATDAIRDLVRKAVERGVRRLVLLSGRGEEEAQRCERIVQDSGIEWTVVRASWFNQNFSEGEFLGMVLAGEITLPAGEVGEPFVDADDIADVAVAALTEDGHAGQIYEVTGPRLLTFTEVAQEIARASGREIRYVRIPREAFAAGIAESGAPDDIAWLLDYLFATVLDGRNAVVCDGVQRALGREPKDFTEYARRAADSGVWKVSSSPDAAVGQ
ncbi:MAG: NAD(P)H-binding protein [Woeseia sp.]